VRDASVKITAVNPTTFLWQTDPKHVVQVYGIAIFFTKISALISRELMPRRGTAAHQRATLAGVSRC
jgi:hypothetical protein